MKISAETKARNRQAILDTAARLVREKGPEGLGVAEVMAGAGMTHGGFYNHFASRDDLVAQALEQAMSQANEQLARVMQGHGLAAFCDGYLSEAHLAAIGTGCPYAATACDIVRQPETVRRAFATGLRDYFARASAGQGRAQVIARLSGMLGALVLARAVANEDRELALELLTAARGTSPGQAASG